MAAEFKLQSADTSGSYLHRAKSMNEVREKMKARGLDIVLRDDNSTAKRKHATVDPQAEEEIKQQFLQQCVAAGLDWSICHPFAPTGENEQPGVKHSRQAFFYATRFNSHFKEAKTMFIDMSRRKIVYLDKDQKELAAKDLIGSKVSSDLISKTKFHVWFLGDKAPINHTLHEEAEYHGVPEDGGDDSLAPDKFEEHSPRDHAANVAKLRTHLSFPIVVVHKGVIEKRGKSGLTHNSRYCRVVNGHLLIYRSVRHDLPLDSVCLFGMNIEQSGRNAIKLIGKERSYQLRCQHENDRDKWLTAFNLGKIRGIHEWRLTLIHLEYQKKKQKALRHSRSMHSTHNLKSSSSSSLARGYSMSLDPNQGNQQDQWIDDLDAIPFKKSYSMVSVTITEEDEKERNERREARRLRKSKSRDKNRPLSARKHASSRSNLMAAPVATSSGSHSARGHSEPQHRARQQSYGGGHAEFEVHLLTMRGVSKPIGFIEVQDNDTLSNLRIKIQTELDNVPQSFIFLRDSVPVGRRQEAKKLTDYVVSELRTVRIKEEPVG